MNLHGNARTTPCSRAEIVRRVKAGQPPKAVATAFGVTVKVVNNWTRRFETEGAAGLEDRSSRPHRLRKPTPPETVARIVALRQRFTGQQIARETGVSRATVSRILRAARPSRARELDPPEPVVRYEREHPGELIHLDIKKLGRFDVEGHRVTGDRRKGASRGAGAPAPQPDPARREEGARGRLAVKTADQQAELMMAGLRDALVRRRTQLTNMIRGHAAEFGLVAARGLDKLGALLLERIAADATLPALARELFATLGVLHAELERRLDRIDEQLRREPAPAARHCGRC